MRVILLIVLIIAYLGLQNAEGVVLARLVLVALASGLILLFWDKIKAFLTKE